MTKFQRRCLAFAQEQGIEVLEVWRGGKHHRARCRLNQRLFTITLMADEGDPRNRANWRCQLLRAIQRLNA